ncbi:MAG: DNA-binding NtrC family response regulator [Candidatus Marinamargulisbacteria bacterium]
MLLCQTDTIEANDILVQHEASKNELQSAIQKNAPEDTVTKLYAKEVYSRLGNKKKETARILGINYKTLVNRLSTE